MTKQMRLTWALTEDKRDIVKHVGHDFWITITRQNDGSEELHAASELKPIVTFCERLAVSVSIYTPMLVVFVYVEAWLVSALW